VELIGLTSCSELEIRSEYNLTYFWAIENYRLLCFICVIWIEKGLSLIQIFERFAGSIEYKFLSQTKMVKKLELIFSATLSEGNNARDGAK